MTRRIGVARIGCLLWALLAVAIDTATAVNAGPLAGLESYIEDVRGARDNVGLAVAVVQGDQVLYVKGFGVREAGTAAEVDADTLFQVGSTSKAFGVAALGLLVDEGKIQWDDPVVEYLSDFQLADPWLTRQLTIRDTVLHRSGYRDSAHYVTAIIGLDDVVHQLRYQEPEQRFRDSFIYSNMMYAVAGKVVEVASGMPWREFVRSRLLGPLNMTRTGLSPYEFWEVRYVAPTFYGSAPAGIAVGMDRAKDANLAMPHSYDSAGKVVPIEWGSFENAGAAGSVVSSANDMAKWLVMHLNQGRFEGRQVLSDGTLAEIFSVGNSQSPSDFPLTPGLGGYAMGWRRGDYRGRIHLEHGGSMIGFPAYVAMLPEQRVGVVVLSNGPRGPRDGFTLHKSVAYEVFDRFLGGGEQDWKQVFLDQLRAGEREFAEQEAEIQRDRLSGTRPTLPLDAYAGWYEDSMGRSGPVEITVDKGLLRVSFAGEGAFSSTLEHWHQDIFRFRPGSGANHWLAGHRRDFLSFDLGVDGQVQSFRAFNATFRPIFVEGEAR